MKDYVPFCSKEGVILRESVLDHEKLTSGSAPCPSQTCSGRILYAERIAVPIIFTLASKGYFADEVNIDYPFTRHVSIGITFIEDYKFSVIPAGFDVEIIRCDFNQTTRKTMSINIGMNTTKTQSFQNWLQAMSDLMIWAISLPKKEPFSAFRNL
jgi:hypothetical protein